MYCGIIIAWTDYKFVSRLFGCLTTSVWCCVRRFRSVNRSCCEIGHCRNYFFGLGLLASFSFSWLFINFCTFFLVCPSLAPWFVCCSLSFFERCLPVSRNQITSGLNKACVNCGIHVTYLRVLRTRLLGSCTPHIYHLRQPWCNFLIKTKTRQFSFL